MNNLGVGGHPIVVIEAAIKAVNEIIAVFYDNTSIYGTDSLVS